MKQYKGWEIAKMICESELKEECIIQDDRGYTYKLDENKLRENEFLCDNNISLNMFIDKERNYRILSQPVTFDEVIHSNKKCRVEHELITDLLNSNITLKEFDNDELEHKWFMEYKYKGYLQLNLLMDVVMGFLNAREYKTVIKEGKWYLSDEEDIDVS